MKVAVGLSATHFYVGGEITRGEIAVSCSCGCGQEVSVAVTLLEICPLPFLVIRIWLGFREVAREE